MKVLTAGHKYELDNFEDNTKQRQAIQFIEKWKRTDLVGTVWELNTQDANKYLPGDLVTINDGTTNEEVLAVLIDRMKYLNNLYMCKENSMAITKLEEALMWLEKRTKDREARGVKGKAEK